jgi:medium-chain acyl-[acyl-carrier-protein] hydrolase
MGIHVRTLDPWFVCQKRNASARLRLFCIPYAGGAANIYRKWTESLGAIVEVWAIEPPGRGSRLRETPFTTLHDLVQQLGPAFHPYLDKPFAFFGHSMGAIISFELARYLRRARLRDPLHLFVSGCRALQLPDPRPPTYDLPEAQFMEELRRLNGTPRDVLDHPEMMEFILPLLRADFALTQTYEYSDEPPLDCSITAFGGFQDEEINRAGVEAWQAQTSSAFSSYMLPGDHFFLDSSRAALLEVLARELESAVDGSTLVNPGMDSLKSAGPTS